MAKCLECPEARTIASAYCAEHSKRHVTHVGQNQSYYHTPFCRCGWTGRTYIPSEGEAARQAACEHVEAATQDDDEEYPNLSAQLRLAREQGH